MLLCSTNTANEGSPTNLAILNPVALQVDSAGNIWVASRALVEILGTGAPTWPLLAYGHPGAAPQ